MNRSAFAQTLRRLRLAHGWTQQELAERAGLSARAISDLERGTNQAPRLVTVRLLVGALGLAGEDEAALRTAAVVGEGSSRAVPSVRGHAALQDEVGGQPAARRLPGETSNQFQFEIRYAKRVDGGNVAYGFAGRGPVLLVAPGFVSHLEWWQKAPGIKAFLQLLTEHRTVVLYDRHGCGLSDRDRTDFTSEDDMLDIEAVAAAVGQTELDLLGTSFGTRPTTVFAARHPELVRRLILYGAFMRGARVPDKFLERRAAMAALRRTDFDLFCKATAMVLFPNGLDERTFGTFVQMMRIAATAEMQERLESVRFDLESILGTIKVPTLVLHRRDDQGAPFAHGQYLARQIPNARFVPLEGSAHPAWAEDYQSVVRPILDFLLEEHTLRV